MAQYRGLTRWEAIGCAAAALLATIASLFLTTPATALLGGCLFFAALTIAVVDYRNFIIPDSLSLPAIPLGVFASFVSVYVDFRQSAITSSLIGALVGGCSFYAVRSAYRRLRGFEGLGMGDVKLAAAAGAWVGIEGLPIVLFMATGAAVSTVAVKHVIGTKESISRTTPVPFGSFLAPSLWLVWLSQQLAAPL